MTQQADIIASLTEIFRTVFARPDLVIARTTNASDIEGWDSFMHINLIVAIEEHFKISFTTEQIGAFTCVGDVVDRLQEKLG